MLRVARDRRQHHAHPHRCVQREPVHVGTQRSLHKRLTAHAGDNVVRVDVAKPLDDGPGESDSWQLSLTVGQVFTFGR